MKLPHLNLEALGNDGLRRPANLCAFLFFTIILVPQTTLVWRPWLILATFSMWFLCSLGPKLSNAIRRVGPLALLPAISFFITLVKMFFSGGAMEKHMPFLAGPVYLSLVTFLCGFYLLHDTRSLQRIRIFSVIVLGAVTAFAIPLAYAEPGVGKILAMYKPFVLELGFDPDSLTIQGVPGYAIVYTIAMVALLLLSWVREARSISRAVCVMYVAAVAVLVAHVFLSMLTLAVVAGVTVFVGGLLFAIEWSRVRHRFAIICGIGVVVFAVCQLEHVSFVRAKAFRLVTGMASQGIEAGDETGRGGRLFRSLNTFSENPLLGCDFSSEELEKKIGDHSSLVDPLGMYGILGCIPMILYHFIIVRNGLRTWNVNRRNLRGIGELGAWVFYGACSFWNTTTYTVLPLSLLFLQFVPPSSPDTENTGSKSNSNSKSSELS